MEWDAGMAVMSDGAMQAMQRVLDNEVQCVSDVDPVLHSNKKISRAPVSWVFGNAALDCGRRAGGVVTWRDEQGFDSVGLERMSTGFQTIHTRARL